MSQLWVALNVKKLEVAGNTLLNTHAQLSKH